jgi:hypothetical protein
MHQHQCQYKECTNLKANPEKDIAKAWNVSLCPTHANSFSYQKDVDRAAWLKKNTVEKVLGTCPNCERQTIMDGDYLCTECREDLGVKWAITFPRTTKTGLKTAELQTLLKTLVEQEVPFEVKIHNPA